MTELTLMQKLQKPLEAHEIHFRVQSINKGGYATILAYKDARADADRLDAVFGFDCWQNDFKKIDGVLFGGVGVFVDSYWTWKWDAGSESMAEAKKGEASDAFKRACFKLGIGRELYNYPVIQVKLRKDDEWKLENGKAKATWNLKIKEWVWVTEFDADGQLSFIGAREFLNNKWVARFTWGTKYKEAVA